MEFSWESGTSGLARYQPRKTTISISSGSTTGTGVACEPGEVVVGGGFTVEPLGADGIPRTNGPVGIGVQPGWLVLVTNTYAGSIDLTITALCVTAPAP